MRKALELALEALESCDKGDWSTGHVIHPSYNEKAVAKAITALRQAIEQAQKQEPLCTAAMFDDAFLAKSGLSPDTKLYTSPPQRQPLTDEEMRFLTTAIGQAQQIIDTHNAEFVTARDDLRRCAELLAAHGITGEKE